MKSGRNGRLLSLVMLLLLAVSLAVIIVFNLTSSTTTESTTESLFQNYMQIPSIEVMPGGGNNDPELQKALDFYQKQEFSQALPFFDRYLAENPVDQRATFYQSISYLLTGSTDLSIPGLIQVSEGFGRTSWKQTAEWYLGLAYLKNDQQEEARQVFGKISSIPDHPFSREAALILSEF